MRRLTPFLGFLTILQLSTLAWAAPPSGKRGMVASGHPDATAAGVAMLRQGGNAVDAAVATAFALAVVEPYSSGIGGGGFAVVKLDKTLTFLDFREVAPAAAHRDMYIQNGVPNPLASRDGITSVAVPGAVAGYLGMHKRYGKLTRAQVLAPAIKLARDGFVMNTVYQRDVAWRIDELRKDPEAVKAFLSVDAQGVPQAPELGVMWKQPDLAWTLEQLAADGADAFYTGTVAKKLIEDQKARGGIMTARDLARYRIREHKPLMGSFRGHAVATAPPPSAGGEVLLSLLNMLETMPADRAYRDPAALHLYVEASKRAFADRYLIADPKFVRDVTRELTTKERAQKLAAMIGPQATNAFDVPPGQAATLPAGVIPKVPLVVKPQSTGDMPLTGGAAQTPPDPNKSPHTTHLSVVDADGNAVSLTATVNYAFGSCVVAKGTGVLWNDEMDDFSVAPGVPNTYGVVGSEANAVAPGKVPASSMTPTIVFDGPSTDSPVRLVVGSPGGPRIPTTVAQIIINYFDAGADVQQAVAMGRVHHQHLPDAVSIERLGIDAATLAELEKRGHAIKTQNTWSNATAIAIDPRTKTRSGAADPRGVGAAMAE